MKSLPLLSKKLQQQLYDSIYFQWLLFIFHFLHAMRWLFESKIFSWKSSTRIDRKKNQKIFKNTAERLLLTRVVVLCISDASTSGKILPRVVKFYREIFYESRSSNTSRRLLLKLPGNNQSFLIQSKVSKHYRIFFYGISSNFLCI